MNEGECTGPYGTEYIQYTCMYVCHSCVTSGHREGSAAPAFVPNRKQTHKERMRSGRERGGGGGGVGGGEEGRKRWAKQEKHEEEEKKKADENI